jgi:hypothetical protein
LCFARFAMAFGPAHSKLGEPLTDGVGPPYPES